VGIEVTLHRHDGHRVTGLADPNGGTFDAAGDFDRLIDAPHLPIIGGFDRYRDSTLDADHMAALIADVVTALESASPGPEVRGLRRLRAMAARVQADESLILRVLGD
jgi:hypothetical protein